MNRFLSAVLALVATVAVCGEAMAQGVTQTPPSAAGQGVEGFVPGGNRGARVYGPRTTAVPSNTAIGTANRLWVVPVFVAKTATLKTLAFDIGTGNSSAWNGRMCVFLDTGSGLPGANVVDSGTVAIGSGSVTGIQSVSLNSGSGTVLSGPATYWVGMMTDSTSESLLSMTNGESWILSQDMGFTSNTNIFNNSPTFGWYMAQTLSSGCPTNFSASPTDAAGQSVPYVAMGY